MDEKELEKRRQAVLKVLNQGISGNVYNVNEKDIERKKNKFKKEIKLQEK